MDARVTRLLAAAACVFAAGCAGSPAAPLPRAPETPAALARPEPDPACRGTVQGLLASNGLEQVTVSLSVDAAGRAEIVEFLAPALTPAAKVELQRAFASCAWAPVPASGSAEHFTTTFVRERAPAADPRRAACGFPWPIGLTVPAPPLNVFLSCPS